MLLLPSFFHSYTTVYKRLPDMKQDYTIVIVGCGTMGTAVLASILNPTSPNFIPPAKIVCCTNSAASSEALAQKYGDKIITSHGVKNYAQHVKEADVVILGVKPFYCQEVLDSLAGYLNSEQLIISLIAGWTMDKIAQVSKDTHNISYKKVARVMTNTPAQFGYGMACISFSSDYSTEDKSFVLGLFDSIGKSIEIPEKNMDAATSLVGSGPAFVLLMLESMIDGAVKMGIPYAIAKDCALKVMEGTAKMCEITNDHPAALKSKVCTPGGTTIGGLMAMEERGVRYGIARGIQEAANIATELGKK